MNSVKKSWKRLPRHVRRPIVVVTGSLILLISATIGWLPGPGGIPLFLLGIAILASEFTWAERIRDLILDTIDRGLRYCKRNPLIATLLIVVGLGISASLVYLSFFS